METLLQIRNKSGLSQYQLADCLDISRSLVNMAEKELRTLPTKASQKVAEMEKILSAMEPVSDTVPPSSERKSFKKEKGDHLQKQENHLITAKILQRRLKATLRSYQQSNVKVKLINELSKNTEVAETKVDDHWLEYHGNKGRKKIVKDAASIEKLTIDIELQLGYAKVHEEILKKYFKV